VSPTRRSLLLGTLAVGTLDILDAFIFFGLRSHAKPERILQSIAAGLLGKASFTGGAASAALGLVLHYFIAFCIVGVYLAASRRITVLREFPLVFGPLYGLAAYAVMNYVVIPLSAAGTGKITIAAAAVLANGLAIHMLGIGLPAALAARSATSGGGTA